MDMNQTPAKDQMEHKGKPQVREYLKVPELSLKSYLEGKDSERQEFIQDFFAGLKHYGFIVLKDHPIDVELLRQAYQLSQKLFELPVEEKLKLISPAGGGQRGYTPFGKEHAKDAKVPDLKEFWHVGRDLDPSHPLKADYPENIWPAALPEFKPTFQEMYKRLDDVGRVLLEALTGPLKLEADYFETKVDYGSSVLRLLHYPPIPEGVDPRCIRAAAHEDINLITILVSASASGLELLDRDGKWLAIETSANNLIVDSGDMLARITNDVIPSTTHRVVNPAGANTSRYSMPFFMHPNPDALLTCLESCRGNGAKYPDITAGDFLKQRLKEIGLT